MACKHHFAELLPREGSCLCTRDRKLAELIGLEPVEVGLLEVWVEYHVGKQVDELRIELAEDLAA